MANRTKSSPEPKAFPPQDNIEVLVTDPATGNEVNPRAFIPNGDGTLIVKTLGGNIEPIPVKAGAIYAIIVKEYRVTGTSAEITSVTGLL